jgi:hypothetical protein
VDLELTDAEFAAIHCLAQTRAQRWPVDKVMALIHA